MGYQSNISVRPGSEPHVTVVGCVIDAIDEFIERAGIGPHIGKLCHTVRALFTIAQESKRYIPARKRYQV